MALNTTDPQGQCISVQVCAAYPDHVIRQTLLMPAGSPLGQIRAHQALEPGLIACWDQAAGFSVYGEKRTLQSRLEDGDRIEILRPLQADPKEARRLRAKLKGKT